jgi:hypothetical protein
VSAAGETARNDFAETMPEKAQVTSHSLVWFAAAIKGRRFHRRIWIFHATPGLFNSFELPPVTDIQYSIARLACSTATMSRLRKYRCQSSHRLESVSDSPSLQALAPTISPQNWGQTTRLCFEVLTFGRSATPHLSFW